MEEERIRTDPEYAAVQNAKTIEKNRRHNAQQKAKWDDIRERAKTDPAAAEQLASHLKKHSEATIASRRKLIEEAKTDPEAAAKLEAQHQRHLEYNREYSRKKKTRTA